MSDFIEVLTSGASAVSSGQNLESYNPYPALMWILVFVLICQQVFIFMLLKINEKNAKANELNRANINDLERGFERMMQKMDEHNVQSINNHTDLYKTFLEMDKRRDKE